MTGPAGFGANGFIASSSTLAYRIDFENVTNATAPAQQVIISDQLSTNFDWTTFNVSEIGFGDLVISIPPGTQQFQKNVPFSYLGTNFQVQVQVGINLTSGQISATLRSIDPTTSLPPPVNIGFLPPEDGTGRGQGHVTYTVHAKAGLPTGTQLVNVALISFDNEPQIATDQLDDSNPAAGIATTREALITLDSVPPTSHVLPLPAQSQLLQIPVSWTGQDDPGGSGVASFNIYVSDNGGSWSNWLAATTSTNATFQAKPQHTYGFTSQAGDNAGNLEAQHLTADATTLVVANPQFQLTVTPTSTNLNINDTFSYTVTVKNIGSLSLNNVTLSNAMPAGIGLNWVMYGRGAVNIGTSSLLWSLGTMTTNANATLTVNVPAVANGTWSNLFTVADSDGAASSSASQLIQIGPVPPPALSIALVSNRVVISWSLTTTNFYLESTVNLNPANWLLVTNAPVITNGLNNVTLPVVGPNQFFRLSTVQSGTGSLAPVLTFAISNQQITLLWSQTANAYHLENSTNIALPSSWSTVTNNPALVSGQYSVTLPMIGQQNFFRLRYP
jgi:uncharacterized repeat protein (TIGR01451 family)